MRPGDLHYRAFVGPPGDFDLIAATTFSLLCELGLRGSDTLTDVGCGSLRLGRLLIPYLNQGNYTGIEPNSWLVHEGVSKEVGQDLIRIKKPTFSFRSDARDVKSDSQDFVLAQSIFSHCGPDLLYGWAVEIARILRPRNGKLVATFVKGVADSDEPGWVYPHCTKYTWSFMLSTFQEVCLDLDLLDWFHPRQCWFIARRAD